MSSTNRLRASCERCRGQKLRCLPSFDPEPTAPCQRCVKAKVAESCVFRTRSRTQRPTTAKASPDGVLQGKDLNMELTIPGTNLFALCSPFSSSSGAETSDADPSFLSASIQDASHVFSLDECRPQSSQSVSTGIVPDTWEDCSQEAVFQQYPWNESLFMDGIDPPAPRHTLTINPHSTHTPDGSTRTEARETSSSPPSTWAVDMLPGDRGVRLDDILAKERSDPLVDLTNLLAEMSPYEQQLSRLSDEAISDYPIGDALFFSHSFRTILSPSNKSRQGSTISALGTPTVLLVLSCFMTLNRIYSVIFRHLAESLSRGPTTTHKSLNGSAEFRSYRGLRLNQLHQVSLCSQGELVKNAVSMLLESLGSAEDLLDLPPDAQWRREISVCARIFANDKKRCFG
ncbi:uncharacterized protein K460DRAFT_425545 [Cucurbitaria berberidis CBS 394.84]|uniref:Zn(2)-C6 fungal-type domain-containing protein n=1 Tax=Cucurbitaria berberidis CBS 394.84 TaxID=1168544 RepID=A0A9P4LA27_9PLEO|nr:uncharacterized protein K460DRAFT_425545 [Cucurbitaria berberidis CBS 394.84]KAF1846937.1 hypothetical protein K460DRAFT_425545 [Cucurbitaria berberidis CBS 394.84]